MYAQNAKAAPQPVEATINDRLNKVAENLQHQIERISAVLSRVNGTPSAGVSGAADVAQIRPVQPLTQAVEHLESISGRVADLATGVERIA